MSIRSYIKLFALCAGAFIFFVLPPSASAQSACTQTLSSGVNLQNALASAAAGSVICLNNGSYSGANFYSTKSPAVTVRAVNPGQVTISYSDINAGSGLIIDGVVIGGALLSGNAKNITIQNSTFSAGLCINMRNVAGSSGYPLNITIDNNVFDNLGQSCFEGRISISDDDGHQNSMGVVIKNNKIKNGCSSDGIFIGGGASGVTVGPNNEFSGINQSGAIHCDNIQFYGSGWNNTIEGNFFNGGSTLILIDGNDNGIIRNNVFKSVGSVTLDVQNACPSSTYPLLIEHNTFHSALLRINYYCNATIRNNAWLGGTYSTVGNINCTNCSASYNVSNLGTYGSNSIQGTIQFAGGSNPTTLSGYQLTTSSPGKSAGSDGQDMGTLYYGTPTVSDTTPPTLPSSFNLAANATSSSSITVSWNPAADDIGVSSYLIERCTGLSCSNFAQVGTLAASPFVDSGLSASAGYSYHVRAVDAAGNMSGWSNVVGATTSAATPTPTVTLSASPTSITSGGTSMLTWSSTNATSCTASGSWTGTKATSGTETVSPLADATYTLTCTGTGGNANQSATISVAGGNCTTAPLYPSFNNQAITPQTGTFTLEFDATAPQNNIDGVMGLSNGNASDWASFATIVRFTTSGTFDARNGAAYQADTTINYQANTTNHIRMTVDVPNHTYSVFVTPVGQSEQTLASNYAFRTEQATVSQLDTLVSSHYSGVPETVCNVTTETAPANTTPQACSTVTPTNFTDPTFTGYGAPYDVFASNTPLISTQCSSTDTHTLTATLGIPGDTTRIVYTKGYYYDPGINDWTSFTGTCTGTLNGDWCQGSVATSITDTDISTASVSDPSYLVGFTCRSQNGSWKCGCRDTSCSNFYWQVQGAGM